VTLPRGVFWNGGSQTALPARVAGESAGDAIVVRNAVVVRKVLIYIADSQNLRIGSTWVPHSNPGCGTIIFLGFEVLASAANGLLVH
jgi:hypothetical protein